VFQDFLMQGVLEALSADRSGLSAYLTLLPIRYKRFDWYFLLRRVVVPSGKSGTSRLIIFVRTSTTSIVAGKYYVADDPRGRAGRLFEGALRAQLLLVPDSDEATSILIVQGRFRRIRFTETSCPTLVGWTVTTVSDSFM
jgi:hypothetical protein